MDARQQRGLAIAATAKIVKKGNGTWIVPSTTNWPADNAAQTSEKETFCRLLRDLCGEIPEPEQQRGRPRLPIGDALFTAAFKVYSTVSARRFMTDLRKAEAHGLISRAPCYNSISNVIESEQVMPIIQSLITKSSLPLRAVESDFAADSTGFGLQRFYRHFTAKYGHDQVIVRDYIKVHAMIGVKTHIVTSATVTATATTSRSSSPCSKRLGKMLTMAEVSADNLTAAAR